MNNYDNFVTESKIKKKLWSWYDLFNYKSN